MRCIAYVMRRPQDVVGHSQNGSLVSKLMPAASDLEDRWIEISAWEHNWTRGPRTSTMQALTYRFARVPNSRATLNSNDSGH